MGRSTPEAAALTAGISNEFNYGFAIRGAGSLPGPGATVLDLGSGTGGLGKALRAAGYRGRLVGMDVVDYPDRERPSYDDFVVADLDGPFERAVVGMFDVVFACEMAVCLENVRALARSMAALVKPGGRIVLTSINPASLSSLLLLARRGVHRGFGDAPGEYPGVISAWLPVDVMRAFAEAGLVRLELAYSDRARWPRTTRLIQETFPFARGRWFSDGFRVAATAP